MKPNDELRRERIKKIKNKDSDFRRTFLTDLESLLLQDGHAQFTTKYDYGQLYGSYLVNNPDFVDFIRSLGYNVTISEIKGPDFKEEQKITPFWKWLFTGKIFYTIKIPCEPKIDHIINITFNPPITEEDLK